MNEVSRRGRGGDLMLSDVFDRWLSDRWAGDASISCPVDVVETDKEYRFTAEIPGLRRENLSVTLENNILTISGEKKEGLEATGEGYRATERRFGRFVRSFTIPSRVESDKITANYQDGVLEVVLPKAAEAQPRRIEISPR